MFDPEFIKVTDPAEEILHYFRMKHFVVFTLWSLHGERERSEQSHQKRKLICFETNYKQWKLGNFAGGQ